MLRTMDASAVNAQYNNTYPAVCIGLPPRDSRVDAAISANAPTQQSTTETYAHAVASTSIAPAHKTQHTIARNTVAGANDASTVMRLAASGLPRPGSSASSDNSASSLRHNERVRLANAVIETTLAITLP